MSREFEQYNKNSYEGNGWSKYQLMVLQQLNDHNQVLQNLNKEIVEFKQIYAVADTENKLWKSQMMTSVDELAKKVTHILYDEKGIGSRLTLLEREAQTEEKARVKMKTVWALIGAVGAFVINAVIKFADIFWK